MIQSSCYDCVFSKIKDRKQYGCTLNRTEKFKTKQEKTEDIEHKVCLEFCNTFRPPAWLDRLSIEEKLNADKLVIEEVRPRVGFVVYLDNSKENSIELLKSTLKSIRNQSESNPRYVIVVNDKVEYNEEIHNILLDQFDVSLTKIHLVQLLEVPENKIWLLDEVFKHALNGWIYYTTSGEIVDKDLLKNLHEHLNIKMKKLAVVLPYDDVNGLLFQTSLFKFLNGNRVKVWDEDKKDNRLFLDKVKSMEEADKCILNWSQVNVA